MINNKYRLQHQVKNVNVQFSDKICFYICYVIFHIYSIVYCVVIDINIDIINNFVIKQKCNNNSSVAYLNTYSWNITKVNSLTQH